MDLRVGDWVTVSSARGVYRIFTTDVWQHFDVIARWFNDVDGAVYFSPVINPPCPQPGEPDLISYFRRLDAINHPQSATTTTAEVNDHWTVYQVPPQDTSEVHIYPHEPQRQPWEPPCPCKCCDNAFMGRKHLLAWLEDADGYSIRTEITRQVWHDLLRAHGLGPKG